jgi:hypothetical protein
MNILISEYPGSILLRTDSNLWHKSNLSSSFSVGNDSFDAEYV